jgi:hypothetical protein
VLLDHAGICVAEIARHYQQRHAVHHGEARPGMAQAMKSGGWGNSCVYVGFVHWSPLVRGAPWLAIIFSQDQFIATATSR